MVGRSDLEVVYRGILGQFIQATLQENVARTILAPSIGTLEKQGASFSWLSQLEGRDDRAIEYSQKFELKETLYSKEAPPAPTDIFHSKIDLSTAYYPCPRAENTYAGCLNVTQRQQLQYLTEMERA
ncbi:hypothetical protein J6590_083432 [Homalodisca vitripennis]|nr:hypothetical protein J6590_083432 [Homalodisca vitripennis]